LPSSLETGAIGLLADLTDTCASKVVVTMKPSPDEISSTRSSTSFVAATDAGHADSPYV
jgi:hypothetical protein